MEGNKTATTTGPVLSTKKIPTPCQGGEKTSGGILKGANHISVGWTPT